MAHFNLSGSNISNDTYADIGKMTNLKSLFLSNILTDQDILANLITQNNHSLEIIDINVSNDMFTNLSLLNIASNCHSLKQISICSTGNGHIKYLQTADGLWELFNKCEKLVEMTIESYSPSQYSTCHLPETLKEALKQRRNLLGIRGTNVKK